MTIRPDLSKGINLQAEMALFHWNQLDTGEVIASTYEQSLERGDAYTAQLNLDAFKIHTGGVLPEMRRELAEQLRAIMDGTSTAITAEVMAKFRPSGLSEEQAD